jgi:hypothetical protein
MSSTTFVDKVTVINTAWLNDTNSLVWTVFNGKTTAGTSGTLLRSNGTNIVNTTATYPATAGTSGTILRSDGTNIVNSTATYPGTAGTSGTVLTSNGTNIVNSTATYPSTAGTAGTILRSDGTNVVNTTATYPATTTANQLLYSSATNTISGLTSANSSVLVTNGSGVPSLSTTLPAVTLDTATVAVTQAAGDNSTKVATTAFIRNNNITYKTYTAAPAAAYLDFTSIPSGVKRITIMWIGVSYATANAQPMVQIGDGSVVTTGYLAAGGDYVPTANHNTSTAGFILGGSTALGATGANIYATWTLTLVDSSTNLWSYAAVGAISSANSGTGSGYKALSGALDRVRVTSVAGTSNFDAGNFNVCYEF